MVLCQTWTVLAKQHLSLAFAKLVARWATSERGDTVCLRFGGSNFWGPVYCSHCWNCSGRQSDAVSDFLRRVNLRFISPLATSARPASMMPAGCWVNSVTMACVPFKPLGLKTITSMLSPPQPKIGPSSTVGPSFLWYNYISVLRNIWGSWFAKTKNLIIGADKAMTIPQLNNIWASKLLMQLNIKTDGCLVSCSTNVWLHSLRDGKWGFCDVSIWHQGGH